MTLRQVTINESEKVGKKVLQIAYKIMRPGAKMYRKRLIFFVFILLVIPQANAFWGLATKTASSISKISDSSKALPDHEIIRLSKLSDETKGTAKVGRVLGKSNLPNEVLEDTYIRIAIHQNKITRKEAEGMFSRLGDTPGFRSTLRKIIGNNDAGTAGHLNELKIADAASMHGFKVQGIGEVFTDGLKKAPTDIDIILKKGKDVFAIEAKSYAPTTKIPLDKYRADLDTLLMYKRTHKNDAILIFAITNKPNDTRYLELLEREAEKRDVQLIFGSPQELVGKIKLLGEIL
ncbi:hypothetical protein ACFL3A_04505 [Pseudomonadota bacterium]